MDDARLLELLIKRQNDELSLTEHKELAPFLDSPTAAELELLLHRLYGCHLKFDDYDEEAIEKSLLRLNIDIENENKIVTLYRRKPAIWQKYAAVAALAVIALGIAFFALNYRYATHGEALTSVVETKKGSKSNIVLPDGSKVWINSDTRLTYNESFGEVNRDVELEGEAFFDVVENPKRPFIVHTSGINIRVLGTAFNVRAYKNESNSEATLVRGSVEVLLKNQNNEWITLRPNEKIIVQNTHNGSDTSGHIKNNTSEITLLKISPSAIDSTIIETQWMKNRLSFDQDKLADMIPVLENWFNVRIVVDKTPILQRRFTYTIENESLVEVLESFRLSSGLKYKIDKDIVTIY